MKIYPGKGWKLVKRGKKIRGYCEMLTPLGWRIAPVFMRYSNLGPVATAFRVRK